LEVENEKGCIRCVDSSSFVGNGSAGIGRALWRLATF
jgi:hypothetical protein